jgi:hypothetical protein
MNKAIGLAEKIYKLTMETRCEAKVEELFSNGLHSLMTELLENLDELNRDFALVQRNPTVGMQVVFMHAPSVQAKEQTSSELFKEWLDSYEFKNS